MAQEILIFGPGYTAGRLGENLRACGWRITAVRREASASALDFNDFAKVNDAIGRASHILSSVPPVRAGGDPVLERYGAQIAESTAKWCGYLSSTGVYGDTGGAWVDESAPTGLGRRSARAEADSAWQSLRSGTYIFRLPGIYGPGRSAIDRVREGRAHRIDLSNQVFSRIHVDDIVAAIIASFGSQPGVYNIADDFPCSQNDVIEYASELLGMAPPPFLALDEAGLSDQARAFYSENRRIANGKAKRILGWKPQFHDYRAGLRSCLFSANNIASSLGGG